MNWEELGRGELRSEALQEKGFMLLDVFGHLGQ